MTDALQLPMRFDGATYDHRWDYERLSGRLRAVFGFMRDGQWHTLREIYEATGCPEASASARLRDIRNPKKCNIPVHARRRGEPKAGLWEYRMVL